MSRGGGKGSVPIQPFISSGSGGSASVWCRAALSSGWFDELVAEAKEPTLHCVPITKQGASVR